MKKYNKFITNAKSNDSFQLRDEKITIILLADNYGYRMKSYGPMSLVKFDNKTLIEHQISAISSVFINYEIILCSGFETNKVYNFIQSNFQPNQQIRIVENQIYYHSNCCEGLRLCMNNTMNDKILICAGGIVLTTEYLKELNLKKSSIPMQPYAKDCVFEVGVICDDSRLETMSLAVKDKVWTELIYLNNENLIKSFYNVVSKPEFKNKFLFEALNFWKCKKQLHVQEISANQVFKIDNIKTLKRVADENFVS